MTRRIAILSLIGVGVLALANSAFFLLIRSYKKLDLNYLMSKKALITGIVDTILPKTDSPGAKDAKVQDFVISMISDCTDTKSQYNFIKGLENLEILTLKEFKKDFIFCSIEERIKILTCLENSERSMPGIARRIKQKLIGIDFIYLMKYYTVMGYCTSELGATRGLAYDYIPGSYVACMPLTSHKSWATQ